MGHYAGAGPAHLFEGQHNTDVVAALAVIGKTNRPRRGRPFFVVDRVIIEMVINGSAHADTVGDCAD